MSRSRVVIAAVGTAALVASMATTATSATAGLATSSAAAETRYVVLATSAAAVDAAVASVRASGARVVRVNRDIGLVTAASSDVRFSAHLAGSAGVAGVARDSAVGKAPADAVLRRGAVEREGHGAVAAQAASASGGSVKGQEPLAPLQWDMKMMGATAQGTYKEHPGRKDVLVGVIDTGIDGSHPDIAPNFNRSLSRNFTVDIPEIDGPCEVASCVDPADVDDNGHGTHVAGTIAAPVNGIGMAGVAPNVTLVNLRAGQDSGFFFLGATVDALTFAGDHGVDVVNMSFYTDPWLYNCRSNPADSPEQQLEQSTIIDATQRALNYARAHGVTLIAALGNEHQDLGAATKFDDTSPDFPIGAAYPRTVSNECIDVPTESGGVISVSSVGPSGKKADYSNHGLEQNDVAAPGGFYRDYAGTPATQRAENLILGPYPANVALAEGTVDPITGQSLTPFVVASCSGATIGTCAYWQWIQGTSMAAPHAAGVAALIVSEKGTSRHGNRTYAPSSVEKILRGTAVATACPAPVVTYAAEGRPASYDAPCVGSKNRNSIYGSGIVSAKRAVG
jgi:subtilisin family serine protease